MSQIAPDTRTNSSVHWPDDSLPVAIYCAPGILTDLETLATDGLLAIPRTGLGIGGLLLGRQSKQRLEILRTVAISCSHAMGPSFVLTPEEIAEARASKEGIDGACGVVGWYCSRPNGRMALSENDKALFEGLCGADGQVALLIQPKLGQVTQALFAVRGDGRNGDGFRLGVQGELVAPEKISSSEGDPEPESLAPIPAEARVQEPVPEIPIVAEVNPVPPYMPPGATLFRAPIKQERHLARRVAFSIVILVALAVVVLLGRYLLVSGISK